MSLVNIVNIGVHDNPTTCTQPFAFEIVFECLQELDDDLEWKVIYVADAEDMAHDQTLEEVLVGPIPVGINKFVLEADAPDFNGVQTDNLLGVTVVLVTCSYKDQEFARVGYYVNNEYNDDNYDPALGPPPTPLDLSKVTRHILVGKPRVTRFPIKWSNTGPSTTNENNDDPTSLDVDNEDQMNDVEEDEKEQQQQEDDNEKSTEMLPAEDQTNEEEEQSSNNNDIENESSENPPEEGDMQEDEEEDDIIVPDDEEMEVEGEGGDDEDEEEDEEDDDDDDEEVDLGDDETEFVKSRTKKVKETDQEEDASKSDDANAPSTSGSTTGEKTSSTAPNAVSPLQPPADPPVAAN